MSMHEEHDEAAPGPADDMRAHAPGWAATVRSLDARSLIGVGLVWMTVGLAVVPGRRAESIYHWILGVFLFAPALWLLVRGRANLARRWWTQPQLRLCLALLAWSCVTLLWAQGAHVIERLKVPIFIALYLTGWMAWAGSQPRHARVQRLLYLMALILALAALVAMIAYPWRPVGWAGNRMYGLGMLDGPNLSAYVMGIGFVILSQSRPSGRTATAAWLGALAVLGVFVAWTGCRGAWLALFACLFAMSLWRRERMAWAFAAAGLFAVAVVVLVDPTELLQRGLSYRPQILMHALRMIGKHPLGGLGMGTRYVISVGERSWTHSHNLFSNVAIMVGLPGFVLWTWLWLWTGWALWKARRTGLGGMVLAIWVFTSIALQFDGPTLLGSPRPEWPLTWMPVALGLLLAGREVHDGAPSGLAGART